MNLKLVICGKIMRKGSTKLKACVISLGTHLNGVVFALCMMTLKVVLSELVAENVIRSKERNTCCS